MTASNKDYLHKKLIEGIEILNPRPAPDPNGILLPTKSTEDETTPAKPRYFNDERANAEAEHIQELLNRVPRKD